MSKNKELWVATDFYDDVLNCGHSYTPRQLRALMAYTRSLGATTVTWIVDDMWTLYDVEPGGMDLLAEAVEAAHAEDLKFHAIYKPDEGGLDNIELPHTAPRPEGAVFREDLRGLLPISRPFVAAHPELCMKRWPGDEDPGGAVTAIRLIKNTNEPVQLKAEDLSIWISDVNGRFRRYEKPFQVKQQSRWEPVYPVGMTCRSLVIKGLLIPAQQRYIEIRISDSALKNETFRNDYQNLVELTNEHGQKVPCTLALAEPPRERYVQHLAQPVMTELVRYARHPEVRAFLKDESRIRELASEMRAYGRVASSRIHALDTMRHLSIARGKIPCLSTMLNPVYPEVRQSWLETVRFCLDRGADAVDIRSSKHGMLQENWAYGYNEPVLEALDGDINMARARTIIGEAYTQFLREAAALVHARDRKFGVHLFTSFLRPRDESMDNPMEYMDYPWRTWIREFADFATFRGCFGHRPEVVRYVVDLFGDACHAANIPLIYQSNRRYYTRQDPLAFHSDRLECLRMEMDYVKRHPGVRGYEYYETAGFTQVDARGEFHGNGQFRDLSECFLNA